ncbi:hypothetical protein RHGRI_020364 [Rhododendron griersonianum]|uniref:Uncharacterized protein n=1 Tax=Rhododendron griersonianum TaxID=479676 RepID=A0AAV6JL74_9ERIC|nr:hypothetical protein RHGRI_020364 [Rhododendron griersonianum]
MEDYPLQHNNQNHCFDSKAIPMDTNLSEDVKSPSNNTRTRSIRSCNFAGAAVKPRFQSKRMHAIVPSTKIHNRECFPPLHHKIHQEIL